ncbi:MAG TPA: CoA transferase [Polyangiales bacterium]|jgi:hypothetical protein
MSNDSQTDAALLREIWAALEGPAAHVEAVSFRGPTRLLPSVYEVSALASASIAAASLAVAELYALRRGESLRAVAIDRRHAAAAFRSERYQRAEGWQLPAAWDPLAGDYASRDGFIRLHTNYGYHRDAVLRVLGVAPERPQLTAAVARWEADALERAVVDAGGCAATLRSPERWAEHPQGRALKGEALVAIDTQPTDQTLPTLAGERPLEGIRVLDLTRVIAGPIGTRVLAAYGANVLRIDPPGFEEVPALLLEVTAGKHRAALDLRAKGDRMRFEALLASAHLLVHGYRPDALARLGYDSERLRACNPNLAIVGHDAYGWSGPWASSRGFDSLVQLSCGIAWREAEARGLDHPGALPAQALDHATGYLIAASACRALSRLSSERRTSRSRLSLARTAELLMSLGDRGSPDAPDFGAQDAAPWLECVDTDFGAIQRVRCPGEIAGISAQWTVPAGHLGIHPPQFWSAETAGGEVARARSRRTAE